MKVALVNPCWTFDGSIYFGCREPHLPLELGYAAAAVTAAGGEARLFDAALDARTNQEQADDVAAFAPDLTIVTTAPTYLFWRCPPPELRAPKSFLRALDDRGGRTIAIGPHGSATPRPVLDTLGADAVIRGEPDDAIGHLVAGLIANGGGKLPDAPGLVTRARTTEARAVAAFTSAPPLRWPDAWITRKTHHHHRFDAGAGHGPAAEVEASRGCPYACAFCAKLDARDAYRRRNRTALLAEVDALIAQGVRYLYFIDEIFLPDRDLLAALAARPVQFGVQTRIDLWSPERLAALGAAGCVSIEAGVESLDAATRAALAKPTRTDTEGLTARLIEARAHVPFVQANLIRLPEDDADAVRLWRDRLADAGVWANDPVPMFPYPGSPAYRAAFGAPDDEAWGRAHAHYLANFAAYSDIQDAAPAPLAALDA